MGWKDLSYGLKGSIIGGILLFLYYLIFARTLSLELILDWFFTLPLPLILGALIGSIYGDLKEKKPKTIGFWVKIIFLIILIGLIIFITWKFAHVKWI